MPLSLKKIHQVLGEKKDCHVEASIVTVLCASHPIQKAVAKQVPLGSSWKLKSYYKREFCGVPPVEYILDKKEQKIITVCIRAENIAADYKFIFYLDEDCQFDRKISVARK